VPTQEVRQVLSSSGKERVIIYRRENGTFGFEEERWSSDPNEQCWISFGNYSYCICGSEEEAIREALGRVSWLSERQPEA
jgi:hypothetical protein